MSKKLTPPHFVPSFVSGTLFFLAASLLAAGTLAAEERLGVRLLAAQVEPGDGFFLGAGDEFFSLVPDGDLAVVLGVDYRLSPRFALGLQVLDSSLDQRVAVNVDGVSEIGKSVIDLRLFSLGLDIDLTPAGGFALTLGPLVAWADYGDARVDLPAIDVEGTLPFDSEIVFGARLRAEFPIGRFSILAAVETYNATAESTSTELDFPLEVELDPTVFQLGAGVRF